MKIFPVISVIVLAVSVVGCSTSGYGNRQTGDWRFSSHFLNKNRSRTEFDHLTGRVIHHVEAEDNVTGPTKVVRTYVAGQAIENVIKGVTTIHSRVSDRAVELEGLSNEAAKTRGDQSLQSQRLEAELNQEVLP